MHKWKFAAVTLGILSGFSGLCHAQSPSPISAEVDLDSRVRFAGDGSSNGKLHTSSLRLGATLAPDLHLNFYGTNKYGNPAVQEATVEKEFGPQRLQVGIIRVPFGIYDFRETYASGIIDYAMPRGDYAYHAVDWGAPGLAWHGGTARLQIEAAAFSGSAENVWDTENKVRGGAVRLQTYWGDAIVGASRWDGSLNDYAPVNISRPVHMNGIDLRYTRPQLLIRGEYLFGTLAGEHETGWYVDTYYRLPRFEKWTLTARLEQLKPDDALPTGYQFTLGARYVATRDWTLVVNWRRNNSLADYQPNWTPFSGHRGDLFFQIYHKLDF